MVVFWLAYVALVAQRLWELQISKRHTRALRARGARESGASHYPLMVALHVAWFLCLPWEVSQGGKLARHWPIWVALALAGQGLRWSTMKTLGERWTTRVLVLPQEPPVRSGLYSLFAHPNYLGVALEIFSVPLLFGAWKTACLFSVLNAALLHKRIRIENEALAI